MGIIVQSNVFGLLYGSSIQLGLLLVTNDIHNGNDKLVPKTGIILVRNIVRRGRLLEINNIFLVSYHQLWFLTGVGDDCDLCTGKTNSGIIGSICGSCGSYFNICCWSRNIDGHDISGRDKTCSDCNHHLESNSKCSRHLYRSVSFDDLYVTYQRGGWIFIGLFDPIIVLFSSTRNLRDLGHRNTRYLFQSVTIPCLGNLLHGVDQV